MVEYRRPGPFSLEREIIIREKLMVVRDKIFILPGLKLKQSGLKIFHSNQLNACLTDSVKGFHPYQLEEEINMDFVLAEKQLLEKGETIVEKSISWS